MMMTHRGANFTKEAASIGFLTDIVCPRFALAGKVELGILRNVVPESVTWGEPWVMSAQYHVRKLAQRVFQNSPVLATSDGDLGKMSRPTFRRFEYEDVGDDAGSCSGRDDRQDERRLRELRSERLDDISVGYEGLLYLQGFDPVVQMKNVEQRRGPSHPPDPDATRRVGVKM